MSQFCHTPEVPKLQATCPMPITDNKTHIVENKKNMTHVNEDEQELTDIITDQFRRGRDMWTMQGGESGQTWIRRARKLGMQFLPEFLP